MVETDIRLLIGMCGSGGAGLFVGQRYFGLIADYGCDLSVSCALQAGAVGGLAKQACRAEQD